MIGFTMARQLVKARNGRCPGAEYERIPGASAAVVAVISRIGRTAISEPADMISWADQAIEFRFTTRRSSWQRGPTTDCPGALTLYSDIKGELTAKYTDAGIFDAIPQMY
jgi:hypothetical protein